jgi:hypothetical protein
LRLWLRYGGSLIFVAAAIFVISPFATAFVEQWSRRDIELRSTLVFNSVRTELNSLLASTATQQIDDLFERLTLDERLLAVGFCDPNGTLRYHTKSMPASFSCADATRMRGTSFATIRANELRIVVSSFPIVGGDNRGHFVILHDLAFSDERTAQARTWMIIALAAVAVVGAVLATTTVLLIVRRWLRSLRRAIDDVKAGRRSPFEGSYGTLFGEQVRHLLRELNESRPAIDGSHVEWNTEVLRAAITNQLPDADIIVVSNREPYIHNRQDGGIAVQIPASGLVAAIEPVMRACGGTWIAHGSGSADREVVDQRDCIAVPPDAPTYTLRRVWLSDEETGRILFRPRQ